MSKGRILLVARWCVNAPPSKVGTALRSRPPAAATRLLVRVPRAQIEPGMSSSAPNPEQALGAPRDSHLPCPSPQYVSALKGPNIPARGNATGTGPKNPLSPVRARHNPAPIAPMYHPFRVDINSSPKPWALPTAGISCAFSASSASVMLHSLFTLRVRSSVTPTHSFASLTTASASPSRDIRH